MIKTKAEILAEMTEDRKDWQRQLTLTVITGLGLVGAVIATWLDQAPAIIYGLYIITYLAGGLIAAKEAVLALKDGELNIDLLMVLAALAAAGVGEVRDGAILLFLFSLAGTLEHYAMGNTKRSVVALMDMRPDEATKVLATGETKRVGVEELALGDLIVVRPGERIPIDGEIKEGSGAINQAPITGESVPVDKTVGDKVFAGSLNQNAVLTIAVTATASHSTLARMIELVIEAESKRSPSERFSEWFGQRYTIVVLVGSILALGIFLWLDIPTAEAFYKAATLLVVASPCAIVISVPAAVLSAIAAATKAGVLFKGGAALEDFGNTKIMAFDKTGTLTKGQMQVTHVQVLVGLSEEELLTVAATLESHSTHPLATSVVAYTKERGVRTLTATKVTETPGQGITATLDGESYWAGNRKLASQMAIASLSDVDEVLSNYEEQGETPILIGRAGEILGVILVADTIRAEAESALAELRQAGVSRNVMLTGDTERVAEAIGQQLGLTASDIFGGLLPTDKVEQIKKLQTTGQVAFVGDGVNDAAALVTAQVGVAMGVAGTDAALEAADVALLSDDLRKLVFAYKLSRQANRVIKQNLYFACGIMLLMVLVTLFGHLPLPLGVIGHEGGTLLVVANGLRLLWFKPKL